MNLKVNDKVVVRKNTDNANTLVHERIRNQTGADFEYLIICDLNHEHVNVKNPNTNRTSNGWFIHRFEPYVCPLMLDESLFTI